MISVGRVAFFIFIPSQHKPPPPFMSSRTLAKRVATKPPISSDRRISDIKACVVLTRLRQRLLLLQQPNSSRCVLAKPGTRSELIPGRTSFADSELVVELCLWAKPVTAGAPDSIALTPQRSSSSPAAQRMRYFTGSRDAWRGSLRSRRPLLMSAHSINTHHVRLTSVTLTCSDDVDRPGEMDCDA